MSQRTSTPNTITPTKEETLTLYSTCKNSVCYYGIGFKIQKSFIKVFQYFWFCLWTPCHLSWSSRRGFDTHMNTRLENMQTISHMVSRPLDHISYCCRPTGRSGAHLSWCDTIRHPYATQRWQNGFVAKCERYDGGQSDGCWYTPKGHGAFISNEL